MPKDNRQRHSREFKLEAVRRSPTSLHRVGSVCKMDRFERAQKMMEKLGIKHADIIHDYLFFIRGALGGSSNGPLLDACCGPDSSSLEDLPPSVRKIGFDIDPDYLRQNDRLAYAAARDIVSLPFRSNTFQVVCLHWGIEHIQDPVKALKEVFRILKPGGRVVMMTTNARHPIYFLAKVTPHSFHEFARAKILKTEEKEFLELIIGQIRLLR